MSARVVVSTMIMMMASYAKNVAMASQGNWRKSESEMGLQKMILNKLLPRYSDGRKEKK